MKNMSNPVMLQAADGVTISEAVLIKYGFDPELNERIKNLGGRWRCGWVAPLDQKEAITQECLACQGSDGTRTDRVDLTIWLPSGSTFSTLERFLNVRWWNLIQRCDYLLYQPEEVEILRGEVSLVQLGVGEWELKFRSPAMDAGCIIFRRVARQRALVFVDDIVNGRLRPDDPPISATEISEAAPRAKKR